MTASALIAIRLAEVVVGLTAHERFQAVQHLDSGGSFITSRGFTIVMVAVLAGSVIALVIVNLCIKAAKLKNAGRIVVSDIAAKKGLSESETGMLMVMAGKALERGDTFIVGEAFEHAAATLLEESYSGGKATAQTSQLQKQLAGLRRKLGIRTTLGELAESMKATDARRLAGALAGLSEAQVAQLSEAIGGAEEGQK
jgi:hypothetical protein